MASIRKKNGKWFVDYYVGSTRFRPSFGTKAEAEAYKRNLLLRPIDHVTGFKEIEEISLVKAVNQYLELVTTKKSAQTQILEERTFKEFVGVLGNQSLQVIGMQSLEAYQVHLRKRLAPQTVNRHFTLIKHFFGRCIDWDFLEQNPAQKIKPLKNDRQKVPKTLEKHEIEAMLRSAEPYMKDIIFAMVRMGLRRKEIINLRWRSVKIEDRLVNIESSEGFHPKGYKPRTFPLDEELQSFFREKKLSAIRSGLSRPDDFVFVNSLEHKIHPMALTTSFARLGKRIGIQSLGPHRLRHTFCTDLVKADVGTEKVRALAGHSDIRTTERYLHVDQKSLGESVERLSNVYRIREFK